MIWGSKQLEVNVFSARQFDWGAEEVAVAAGGEEDDDEAGRKERGVNSIIFIVTDVTEKSPASFFSLKSCYRLVQY